MNRTDMVQDAMAQDVDAATRPQPATSGEILRVRDLNVQIADKTVLDDVTLDIGANERVGLIGASGSLLIEMIMPASCIPAIC